MTQQTKVLAYLRTGDTLTGLIAWRKFKIYRLSDVIFKLRRKHNIHCENIKVGDNTFGHYTYLGEKK